MPPQSGKSPISGLNAALQANANNPVEWVEEFGDPPGNIKGGIAMLTEARMGEYKTGPNQGKPFIYLAGSIVEPVKHIEVIKVWENNKVKVAGTREVITQGKRTNMTLPLCETTSGSGQNAKTTTLNENVADALNHLNMLSEGCTANLKDDKDLVNLLAELKGAQPAILFKFSTTQSDPTAQYPVPRVWQNWHGTKDVPADYAAPIDLQQTDNSGGGNSPPTDTATAAEEPAGEDSSGGSGEEAAAFDAENASLDELVAVASGDPGPDCEAAIAKITAIANEAGISDDDIEKKYQTWPEVAAAITEAQSAPAAPEWKKGDACSYNPKDKAGKPMLNKSKKPIMVKCQITAVNKDGTFELLNLTDKKTKYSKIKAEDLEAA